MKVFIMTLAVILVFTVASTATAEMKNCKGDATRSNPPIPNNPLHIRNVIWRNMRTMCLQKSDEQLNKPHLVEMSLDELRRHNITVKKTPQDGMKN